MKLPVPTDFAPMEARSLATLPAGRRWQYEPKWDGFRCLAFRDAAAVDLRSRNNRALTRYFPEIARALLRADARRFVLDGEIIVPIDGGLSFDRLLERIHPAASRAETLARETPAAFLVFDLLVDEAGRDLTSLPLSRRRPRLARFVARHFSGRGVVHLSPCTTDRGVAEQWLNGYAGTDGVIAKRLDAAYVPGDRAAMRKIKRMRTADCVVGGFRYATTGNQVGSLLLGLFDDDGLLHHCGFTSSFTAAERVSVTRVVERYANGAGFSGRVPEAHSRWIGERSARWVPVRPELVCEVRYDHFSDGRFRHGTKLLRWRPDKGPRECTFDQVRPKRVRRGKTSRKSTGATAA